MERPLRPILLVADQTHLDAFLRTQKGETKDQQLPDGSAVLKQIAPPDLDNFFTYSSTNMIEVAIVQIEHLRAVLSYLAMLNSLKLIITLEGTNLNASRGYRNTLKARNIRLKSLAEVETWKRNHPKS